MKKMFIPEREHLHLSYGDDSIGDTLQSLLYYNHNVLQSLD